MGNLLQHEARYDVIVVPCNGLLKKHHTLCMGAGAAKATNACGLYTNKAGTLAEQLGISIARAPQAYETKDGVWSYGFVLNEYNPRVAALQTKLHPNDAGSLSVLGYSLSLMVATLKTQGLVGLFYPGIGHAKLPLEEVRAIASLTLDNRYHLWRKD